jgi:NADPH2 dehydrogenase
MSTELFKPLKIGHVELQHRVVMAPLTRLRADKDHVQLPMTIEYYSQRASTPGTLIISEACLISPRAGGAPHMPGIYTEAQIAAWKKVTHAVHAKGCSMFCQLVAPGRAADPSVIAAEGFPLASSSATPMEEGAPVPKELSEEEIWAFISEFAQASKNAIEAGFDGVEIHGANGEDSIPNFYFYLKGLGLVWRERGNK